MGEIGLKCRRNNMKIFILPKRILPNGKLKKSVFHRTSQFRDTLSLFICHRRGASCRSWCLTAALAVLQCAVLFMEDMFH